MPAKTRRMTSVSGSTDASQSRKKRKVATIETRAKIACRSSSDSKAMSAHPLVGDKFLAVISSREVARGAAETVALVNP
jgi:hypothetical protein